MREKNKLFLAKYALAVDATTAKFFTWFQNLILFVDLNINTALVDAFLMSCLRRQTPLSTSSKAHVKSNSGNAPRTEITESTMPETTEGDAQLVSSHQEPLGLEIPKLEQNFY